VPLRLRPPCERLSRHTGASKVHGSVRSAPVLGTAGMARHVIPVVSAKIEWRGSRFQREDDRIESDSSESSDTLTAWFQNSDFRYVLHPFAAKYSHCMARCGLGVGLVRKSIFRKRLPCRSKIVDSLRDKMRRVRSRHFAQRLTHGSTFSQRRVVPPAATPRVRAWFTRRLPVFRREQPSRASIGVIGKNLSTWRLRVRDGRGMTSAVFCRPAWL
jgi:hypothetical protein